MSTLWKGLYESHPNIIVSIMYKSMQEPTRSCYHIITRLQTYCSVSLQLPWWLYHIPKRLHTILKSRGIKIESASYSFPRYFTSIKAPTCCVWPFFTAVNRITDTVSSVTHRVRANDFGGIFRTGYLHACYNKVDL